MNQLERAFFAKQRKPKMKLSEFRKKFGEGTDFDLDYGKLVIIGLCIYIAVQVSQ